MKKVTEGTLTVSTRPTLPTVSVFLVSYGDHAFWEPLAERAWASIQAQTHRADQRGWWRDEAGPVARLRNLAAANAEAKTDFICFLDADDELDPHYLEHALEGAEAADLVVPSVQRLSADGKPEGAPYFIPSRPILTSNYIVISALIRWSLFDAAGGFREDLAFYEDWDLFLRLIGHYNAREVHRPKAVLKVRDRPNSRNKVKHSEAEAMVKRIQHDFSQGVK